MTDIVTLNIACNLYSALKHPKTHSLLECNYRHEIKGCLQLKGTLAVCRFRITEHWLELPPIAICKEPWVKTGAEWHIDEKYNTMCYVLKDEWKDVTASIIENHGIMEICHTAHIWILRNCRWLLDKHVLADQRDLKRWPKEWIYWPHFEDGSQAYRREKERISYERKRKQKTRRRKSIVAS